MTGSMKTNIIRLTVKNAVISPNFLVWKFCGKAQFSHSFGRIARNYPETVLPQNFHTRKSGEITVKWERLLQPQFQSFPSRQGYIIFFKKRKHIPELETSDLK